MIAEIPVNTHKLKRQLITGTLLLLRLVCVVVGFSSGMIAYRDSRYGLLIISLFLAASAAVSLQIPNLSVGEKWRIPVILVLLILVFVIL